MAPGGRGGGGPRPTAIAAADDDDSDGDGLLPPGDPPPTAPPPPAEAEDDDDDDDDDAPPDAPDGGAMETTPSLPGSLYTGHELPSVGSSMRYPSGKKVLNPRTSRLFPWKRDATRRMTPGVSIAWDLKVFIMSRNSLYMCGRSPNSIFT